MHPSDITRTFTIRDKVYFKAKGMKGIPYSHSREMHDQNDQQ